MKQKLFTLLTLLVAIVTGVWGETVTIFDAGDSFWSTKAKADLATNVSNGNVTWYATAEKAEIATGNKTISDVAWTARLKFGGGSTFNSNADKNLVLAVTVESAGTMKVYFISGKANDQRQVFISTAPTTTNRDPETVIGSASDSGSGSVATANITAAGTYYIWSDNNIGVYGVTLTTGTSAKAYTVTATSNNNAYGTAAAAASSLDATETTTITATPKTGYAFTSWAVAGEGSSLSSTTTNPTTLTMGTANATVTATFSAINYTVTHNAATGGTYTISVAGGEATDANTTATIGQTITLAGTPTNPAHTAIAWNVKDAGNNEVTVTNNQFTMPALNVTIAPVFSEPVALNTLFSMTNITGIVNSSEPASIGTVTATISDRSSVEVFNNKGDADGLLYNNAINLNGSSSNYIHITFPSPLQEGDVITATFLADNQGWKLSKTASGAESKNNPYTIVENDALLGATDLYIFKDGSAQISELKIEGQGEIPNLTITSSKTPEVAIGTESTIEYTTSSSGNTTFACSDESVATVSNDGVITGVGAGTATITLTQAADETYRAGFAKVTVTVPETAMFKIKINGSTSTSVTGTIDVATAVTADVNVSSNRKMDKGRYAGFTLNGDYSLKTGDIIEVDVTAEGQGGKFIFYDSKGDNPSELYNTNVAPSDAKTYRFVIPAAMNGKKTVYLRRGGDNSGINEGFNPVLGYIAVYRPESELTLSNTTDFNYGFGGFCAPANFTVTNGAAYKAKLEDSEITLTKIDGVVPANTGVIIVGDKGARVTFNYTSEDATTVTGNELKGTTARIRTSSLKGDADKLLTLQKSTSKFIEYTGEYFPANRAYLTLNASADSKANTLSFRFADPTSVKNVEAVTSANEAKAVKKAIVNGRLVILTEKGYVNALGQIVK